MAELPEVEIFKRHVDRTARHSRIKNVEVRNRRILKEIDAGRLQKGLIGRRIETTRRHGTYLFIGLDNARWLALYFGLARENRMPQPEGATEDRLSISLEEGLPLSPHTLRLQGVDLIESVDAYVERKGLGPDVLDPHFNLTAFKERLAGRGDMMTKALLMTQQILAGIGSAYSDEILFHARIHPRTRVAQLNAEEEKRIFDALKEVLYTAIDRRANPDRLPEDYLISHRHEGDLCPGCGGKIKRVQVDEYTAYYCPACQKAPDGAEEL